MDPNKLEAAIEDIASKIKAGNVVPFIGAGASLRADGQCPPTGDGLLQCIAKGVGYCSNGDRPLGNIRLSTVAQHFEVEHGRDELVNLIQKKIAEEKCLPSLVHVGLAKITKLFPDISLIITTNFENLIETGLGSPIDKKYDVLVQFPDRPSDDISYEFHGDFVAVYKIHGSLGKLGTPQERDSLVITDDDYIEFLANMQQRSFIPWSIISRMSNRHLLFLGYSLQDWDFMVLYKSVIESKNRAKIKKSYTIQKPFEAEGPDAEYWKNYWDNTKRYWSERKNIHALEIDQDEFMNRLLTKLEIGASET